MSGLVKAVKKVFKKVAEVAKKIAVPVLAAGALLFTGGAALGLAPLASGWAGAAATISQTVGLSGTVGAAMTGAITQAGFGALTGGVISKATGGSFKEGAQSGALVGAVTGGISGALKPTQVANASSSDLQPIEVNASKLDPITGAEVVTETGKRGLFGDIFKEGNWLERNQDLVGKAVSGVGQGLMADAEGDAERDVIKERYSQVRSNYAGTDPGAGYRGLAPGRSGQTPSERFDPATYGSFEYQYNRKSGRIERVPVQS